MSCYFRKRLKLSIQAEIERGQKLDNFKKLVPKAVDVETKAVF